MGRKETYLADTVEQAMAHAETQIPHPVRWVTGEDAINVTEHIACMLRDPDNDEAWYAVEVPT